MLSYDKPFLGDTRESAAIYIARHLLDEGAHLSIYDPKVTQDQVFMELSQPYISSDSRERVGDLVTCHMDPYTAATDGNNRNKKDENFADI